jgi:hypothetical protein
MKIKALGFIAGLCLISSQATASVIDVFTVTPGVIAVGESATIQLQISLTPDFGYFNAHFTGGTVTLNSGSGSLATFAIATNVATQSFQQSFTYPSSGEFVPSFSILADYIEQYTSYEQIGQRWVNSGYWQPYSFSCNFFATCWGSRWVDTSHYEPVYGNVTYTIGRGFYDTGAGALTVNAPVTVAPVAETPIPASLPLFVSGAGLLGLLAKRRRRRAAVRDA